MTALAPSRAGRVVGGAVAALITTGIVIGLPALLITIAGPPWTWQIPSTTRLDVALSWPVSTNTIRWGLVIAAWTVWIWLVARLTWEIIAQIAGHRAASQVRGPIRLLAATLTGTIAATAPAVAAAAEPATVIAAPADEAVTETYESDAAASPAEQVETGTERDGGGNLLHTVKDGDTLWGLADHYYHDPTAYPKIFRANQGIVQSNGNRLTDPNLIVNGTTLTIPDTAPAEEDEASAPPQAEGPEPAGPPTGKDQTTEPETPGNNTETDPAAETENTAPAYTRGAWIGAGAFIALSAAAAALMLRRKRRHRTSTETTNASEQPAAATPIAVDDEPITGRLIELQELLETHEDDAEAIDTDIPLATGTDDTAEVPALDHAHGGLGLTGPGAGPVARAALWSAVTAEATVICDEATAQRLGLDHAILDRVPNVRIAAGDEALATALTHARSALEYEPDADRLHSPVAVVFTDSTNASDLPTALLAEEDTYAIILGTWESAWIETAADGTPTAGRIAEGPIAQLGRCYTLDRTTCNDLLDELTDPGTAPAPVIEEITPPQDAEAPAQTDEPEPEANEPVRPPADRFELRLFGNHGLTWRGEDVHFGRNACIDLIAVFALNNWTLTRDEVTEVVAPDATLSQAGDRRTSVVSEARAVFRNLTGAKKDMFIHHDRARAVYRLDADRFTTDLADFDQHLQRSVETDDPAQRTEALHAALGRYTGPLGEDLDEAWDLIDLRRHYQQTAYQAAVNLAELHQDADEPDRAAAVLERACAIDPDEATAWERLADHHRARGDETKADQITARARHRRELARLARH